MGRLGCGRAGAIAGFTAAPVGGVIWVLVLQASGVGLQHTDTSTNQALFATVVIAALVATIVAGLPGILLGFIMGKALSLEPLSHSHFAAAAAAGAITGATIVGTLVGGRAVGSWLAAAIAGAAAGSISLTALSVLRPRTEGI